MPVRAGRMNSARPNIEIRLARVEESPAIAAVLFESFKEYKALYTPQGFAATTPTVEQIQNRWNEGPVWVAEQDGSVVATVGAVPKDDGLYIRSMGVLPSARGLRIGEKLLQEIERFARSCGYRRMFLSTTPFLARAIRRYERFGFTRVEEGPQELFGTPLFTMAKELNPAD
jgi:putative acetyltransferase